MDAKINIKSTRGRATKKRNKGNAYVRHIKEFENLTNAMSGDKESHEFVSDLLSYGLEQMMEYNLDKKKCNNAGLKQCNAGSNKGKEGGDLEFLRTCAHAHGPVPLLCNASNRQDGAPLTKTHGLASLVGIDHAKAHKRCKPSSSPSKYK